ncbi:MAG: hypothetical protein KKG14_08735 [Alphaproteobacteria bacterium]|nr:hypothetical protein [Alphaproteobacteria bacterium]MBU2269773.1 hypothetical protein [Alphaproteobacteria bacterium]MBU2418773.1 hypothetical protein [Alphaproteobacteria bacterium]
MKTAKRILTTIDAAWTSSNACKPGASAGVAWAFDRPGAGHAEAAPAQVA